MTAKFSPETAGALVRAVRAGATFDEACSQAGVNINTGRGWLRNGRRDPQGPYGPMTMLVDGHRRGRRDAERAASEEPMTPAEFEGHLAAAVRSGSVPAMRLYADLHREKVGEDEQGDDFAALDELAARRAA